MFTRISIPSRIRTEKIALLVKVKVPWNHILCFALVAPGLFHFVPRKLLSPPSGSESLPSSQCLLGVAVPLLKAIVAVRSSVVATSR